MRLAAIFLALVLAACSDAVLEVSSDRPSRIVSLDYCADQYVLKFAPVEHVVAVSPDAGKDFSYMREAASEFQSVRPRAEDILALRPDLVVRSYGGGPRISELLEQAGIEVLQIGWASDLEGVQSVVADVARGLGAEAAGEHVVADMQDRLAVLQAREPNQTQQTKALYMTPGGVTSGPGSMVHELFNAAGLRNFETRPGWHEMPLERLVTSDPDLVVFASFDSQINPWSVARHPVAQAKLKAVETVRLDGAMTSCAAWYLVEAAETLAAETSRESAR